MTPYLTASLLALTVPVLAACTTTGIHSGSTLAHPEARPYVESGNAAAAMEAALLRARLGDRLTLAVFGANWCHDSRAFAGWLQTERFSALTDAHYELVFVDVGTPQTASGRNLDLIEVHGVTDVTGTPTVLIFASDSTLLNAATAKTWRNAASRSEDDIYAELASYTVQPATE